MVRVLVLIKPILWAPKGDLRLIEEYSRAHLRKRMFKWVVFVVVFLVVIIRSDLGGAKGEAISVPRKE